MNDAVLLISDVFQWQDHVVACGSYPIVLARFRFLFVRL